MADYITPPITADPDELVQETYASLQANVPGWEPSDSNLDVWLAEAFSQIIAQVAELATDTQTSIFRYFGKNIASVPAIDATAASGSITVTTDGLADYTIPAGSNLGIQTGEDLEPFQTVADLTIASGSTSGSVGIVASDAGAAGNLDGAVEFIDEFDFVSTVTLVAATVGGADAETDAAYLDRLTDELRLQSPRPILPDDFAQIAKRIPEVYRAVAIDGYNPLDLSTGNERMVTVVAVNSSGTAISSAADTALDHLFNGDATTGQPALREVNFVVHITDANYHAIDVAFTAKAWPGWDTTAVHDAAVAALQSYLSPATWGQPPFSETPAWTNDAVVRFLEVAAVLNNVQGLHYIETLTVNGAGADVTMTGAAPLPTAGTITGTVDPA